MSSTIKTDSEENEGVFKYRKKILKLKLLFAAGVGTIGVLAGFKYGYSKSKVKHGSSELIKDKTIEDPVKFAGRALKRATLITVGCFLVVIGGISIGFGIRSPTDLRNISRRKWLAEKNGLNTQSQDDDVPLKTNDSTEPIFDEDIIISEEEEVTVPLVDEVSFPATMDNEMIVDKAEELTDKWK